MNARELIELLEDLDPNTEVRFMSQPSYPFEYSIAGTWTPEPPMASITCDECDGLAEYDRERDEYHHLNDTLDANHEPVADVNEGHSFTPHGNPENVVYLLEGSQLAYGTKDAWNDGEWTR
jgi:hypothetical protein